MNRKCLVALCTQRDKNDDIPSSEYAELSEEGLRDPTGSGASSRNSSHTCRWFSFIESGLSLSLRDVTLSGFRNGIAWIAWSERWDNNLRGTQCTYSQFGGWFSWIYQRSVMSTCTLISVGMFSILARATLRDEKSPNQVLTCWWNFFAFIQKQRATSLVMGCGPSTPEGQRDAAINRDLRRDRSIEGQGCNLIHLKTSRKSSQKVPWNSFRKTSQKSTIKNQSSTLHISPFQIGIIF